MNEVINELIHQSVSWFGGQLGRQLLSQSQQLVSPRNL